MLLDFLIVGGITLYFLLTARYIYRILKSVEPDENIRNRKDG